MTMKIKDVTSVIETFAPLRWQESYDNAGLVVGREDDEVHAALLAVDVTEEVLDEAERLGCDLVITHHPIVFHPLKRFNSADAVQRCVERAIRRGIALYHNLFCLNLEGLLCLRCSNQSSLYNHGSAHVQLGNLFKIIHVIMVYDLQCLEAASVSHNQEAEGLGSTVTADPARYGDFLIQITFGVAI